MFLSVTFKSIFDCGVFSSRLSTDILITKVFDNISFLFQSLNFNGDRIIMVLGWHLVRVKLTCINLHEAAV